MNISSSTAQDEYNAKWRDPNEVAQTFVVPDQFSMVVKRRNSLIVGPRGSGKTTLLKMCTEEAFDKWQKMGESEVASKLGFVGVFIATDVSWNAQISALASPQLPAPTRIRLQTNALRIHAFVALAAAMEYRFSKLAGGAGWGVSEAREREGRVVRAMAGFLTLSPDLPSFASLRSALRRRLQDVHTLAGDLADGVTTAIPEWCASRPVMVDCNNAVGEFNDATSHSQYWAFLFDETELMPASLRGELYSSLRSISGPIVLKLAISPFHDDLPATSPAGGPQVGHDYDLIPLWYPKKQRGYDFCKRLWKSLVRQTQFEGVPLSGVVGRSLISVDSQPASTERDNAYSSKSKRASRFRQLRDRDPSFASYLAANRIDLDRLEELSGTRRAAVLRKIFPVVVARLEYGKWSAENGPQLRGRKQSPLYVGDPALLEVCEGNPRELIGLVSRMLARVDSKTNRIPDNVQGEEVGQSVARFQLLCRTRVLPLDEADLRLPMPGEEPAILTVDQFVDAIATRLQAEAYRSDFQAEPPGSFIVDERCPPVLRDVLGRALNVGAVVHVPPTRGEAEMLSSAAVVGKRFRLSYLVAAGYGLLPRLGRSLNLLAFFPALSPRDDCTQMQMQFDEDSK